MAKIEDLIFGYREVKITQKELTSAVSLLYRKGIPFTQESVDTIAINERYITQAESILGDKKTGCSFSDPKGLLNLIKHYRHKVALISALLLVSIMLFFLSNMVWDIRVEGNERITDSAIASELERNGLAIGKLWNKIDKSEVEISVLDNNESISWININRNGTVAYVVIKEKDVGKQDEPVEAHKYSNIVATEDCIIEDISVTSGTAVVKIGDVVKAGDILILGALPESGGNKLCNAEGVVIGRAQGTRSVEVARNVEEKSISDTAFSGLKIKFFNFPVNIFKTYRNFSSTCDIIEEKSVISFFGICNLPIEVTKIYTVSYLESTYAAEDDQLITLATQRMNALLNKELADVDLCSIRTFGEFTEQGYKMWCDFVYSCNVAKEVPVYLEENE